MRKIELSAGQQFGRLTVVGPAPPGKGGHVRWICHCECGNTVIVAGCDLNKGHTKSCGCLRVDLHTTHGVYRKHLYWILRDMKRRCNDPRRSSYARYGARGIRVCPEWDDPKAFYEWAISHGYAEGLQIDRIDNDGDYSPDNCRWITKKENLNNTSQNVYIELNGERHTATEWSIITGIPRKTIYRRLKAGKSPEEILKTK